MKNAQSKGERKRSKFLMMGILLCSGVVEPLQAGEFAYGAGYQAEHSDNIRLTSTDERSDWIHTLLTGFAYQENSADLVARVHAQATYYDYQRSSFDNETLFDLNSSAVWTISPQRFLWTLEDNYQQGLVNSTGVDTPANRTNLNVLSTGPDVYLRIAPVHTLALGARVGDVYTGQVNADNKRFTGTAGWLYQYSPTTTLSLNYRALDVKYDNTVLNNDFVTQDVFFRGQFQPSRSQYVIDLGNTRTSFDRGADVKGTLARFSWIRQATQESRFGVSASRELSNTGTDVLGTTSAGETAAPSGLTRTVITGDVYTSKGGTIFYTRRGSLFGAQFEASRRKFDFATTPQDRKETDGRLQIDYFVSALTTASLFTQYTRTEYLNFFQRDTERSSGLRLDHHLNRTVSLGLEARHHDRDSTVSSLNFVDNRALITIQYSSGPLFTPLHRR